MQVQVLVLVLVRVLASVEQVLAALARGVAEQAPEQVAAGAMAQGAQVVVVAKQAGTAGEQALAV